jgi:hypothetical protein
MDENGEYNADYFHHQVLKYAMAQYAGVQGTGQKVKTPSGRGFLKHREGSLEPININYLESEFSVMGQMLYDIEVARVIKMVDDTYNIIDQCRVAAREGNDESIQKMIDAERKESIDQLMKQGASMEDAQKKAVSYTKNQLAFYRRMMAMGFENLGKLAETKKLWTGEKNEWAKAVEALRLGRDELQREEEPTLFPYLSALLNSDHPGATDAATVLKYTSGRREFIKERLGDRYQTYENTMPEGYVLWQPREGNTFYMANSVSERIALELTEGALAQIPISEKDINKIMAVGGRRMEYVIPANIAMTLDNFNKKRPGDRSVKVVRRVMKGYKRWLLMAPQKIVPQQVRNLSGDAEATFVGNPRAFRKGKQAVSDLMPVFFKDAPIKGNVKDFFKMGGFDTAMVVQELGDINQLKVFKRMFEEQGGLEKMTVSAWRKYWDGAQLTMQARESILRYANYLEYLEQMQNSPDGRPLNFGASIPEEIMALPDVKQRAFVLSNQLLGAYDQVSVLGNAFADTLAPFWRWKEVNFRRYTQLFRNAAANGELAGAVGRAATNTAKRSPLIAARIGALILKMTAMTAMLTAFNALVFHDEEEELADNIRAKPHLVLGRNADGSVRYIGNLGTLGDFVQWFGMDAPQTLITDLLNGHISLGEAVKEIALAPVNTIWQTVGPAKSFIEMLLGLKTYPKFWAATGIRDRKLYLFEQFGLGDEYRRITGLPHESLGRKLQKMFFSVTDAGQESYYDIIEDKNRFLKKVGKPTGFTSPDTPKLNALYNLKVALRYGDVDATERYLDEYVKNGGTANGLETSLRNLHPLYGLTSSEKAIFTEDWLNAAGKERLLRAIDYYENILLGRTASEESEDPKGK